MTRRATPSSSTNAAAALELARGRDQDGSSIELIAVAGRARFLPPNHSRKELLPRQTKSLSLPQRRELS